MYGWSTTFLASDVGMLSSSSYSAPTHRRVILHQFSWSMWFGSSIVLFCSVESIKQGTSFFITFRVVIELDGRDCSQALALSLKEKGNSRNQVASGSMPLLFSVSANWQTQRDVDLGPPLGYHRTSSATRFSAEKVLVRNCYLGSSRLTIIEWGSFLDGKTKYSSGRLSTSSISKRIWWIQRLICIKHSISYIGWTRFPELRVLRINRCKGKIN